MPVEYNKSINAMTPGDEIEGYYILKSANPKVAANGSVSLIVMAHGLYLVRIAYANGAKETVKVIR